MRQRYNRTRRRLRGRLQSTSLKATRLPVVLESERA